MATELFPNPGSNRPFLYERSYAKICPCCHENIDRGQRVYRMQIWSMSTLKFYPGFIHSYCLPAHPSNKEAVQRSLDALQAILGYLPPQVYLHQYNRPIVLGQRAPDGGKKIAVPASVMVNPRTEAQLVISLKYEQAYVYRPSYKGTVISYSMQPLYTSSWYPIDQNVARAYWNGELV